MSKKSQDKTSKIRIPIKQNAKTIMMGEHEITIPVLSIYHSQYFKDLKADNFYEMIKPLVETIFPNPNKSQFSYIMIKLLEHNGVLLQKSEIGEEMFYLSDIKMSNETKFIVDDVEYEFEPIMPDDDLDIPLDFLGKKLIGDKVDFNVRGMSHEFIKVYYQYTRDIYVVGSEGNSYEGLGNLIDIFSEGDE